jgi:hypothetical protein
VKPEIGPGEIADPPYFMILVTRGQDIPQRDSANLITRDPAGLQRIRQLGWEMLPCFAYAIVQRWPPSEVT